MYSCGILVIILGIILNILIFFLFGIVKLYILGNFLNIVCKLNFIL